MALTGQGGPLTPTAFTAWTAVISVILAVWMGILVMRVGPLGFTLAFLPSFIAILVLSTSGRFDRLLPVALAIALVGLWPLVRWLVDGDARTAKAYFAVAAFIAALLLALTALGFAKRRGWVVDSQVRHRIGFAILIAMFVSSWSDWPGGGWRSAFTATWVGVQLGLWFWPSRQRPSSTGHIVGV